jgi:hypothetical protein
MYGTLFESVHQDVPSADFLAPALLRVGAFFMRVSVAMANRHKIDRRTARSRIEGSAPAKVALQIGSCPFSGHPSLCSLYTGQSAHGILWTDWRRGSLIQLSELSRIRHPRCP